MRRVAWMLLMAGLPSCGPPYILLEVLGELEIPTATDELHIVAFAADSSDDSLLNVRSELSSDMAFPLDVLLEPSDKTPNGILVFRVRALLESLEVAAGEVRGEWAGDSISLPVALSTP